MKREIRAPGGRTAAVGRRRRLTAWPRRAAVTVEFAMVAPIIFLLIFAAVEFGRALMVMHGVADAARDGCRMAVSWKATVPQIEEIVADRLQAFGVTAYQVTVTPSNLEEAGQFTPVTVHVAAAYRDVSYLPVPRLFSGVTFSGHCCLPKEGEVLKKR